MNSDRRFELIYLTMAWELWAEVGPYKNTPIIREIRIQAKKTLKILTNNLLGITFKEMLGEPISLNLRKRRGKISVRAERQYKHLVDTVERSVQRAATEQLKQPLSKAQMRTIMKSFHESVVKVTQTMKTKYPIEKLIQGLPKWGTPTKPI
jgi:hypothetical protein